MPGSGDNIMGNSDSQISLGLSMNLGLSDTIQDLQQMSSEIDNIRQGWQTLNDLFTEAHDSLMNVEQTMRGQLDIQKELLNAEKELKSLRDYQLDNLEQQISAFERMQSISGRNNYGGEQYGMGMPGQYGGMGGMPMMSGYGSGMMGMMPGMVPGMAMMGLPGTPGGAGGSATSAMQAMEEEEQLEGESPASLHNLGGKLWATEQLMNNVKKWTSPLLNVPGISAMHSGISAILPEGGAEAGILSSGAGMAVMGAVAPLAIGYGAYRALGEARKVAEMGQEYSALTGGTSTFGAMGYNMQAAGMALNPLMPYGVAQQIIQTGLGSGYRGSMQGQYTSFASGNYQSYGMSANESNQMFQAGVIQAGASASQLSNELSLLANVAQTTNTSFEGLQQTFVSTLQTAAGLGAGTNALGIATYGAAAYQGNQLLAGSSLGDMLNTTIGQSLVAQQLGTNYTGLYNKLGSTSSLGTLTATNNALLAQLQSLGLNSKSTGPQIGQYAAILPTLLSILTGKQYTSEEAVNLATNTLSGKTLSTARAAALNSYGTFKLSGGYEKQSFDWNPANMGFTTGGVFPAGAFTPENPNSVASGFGSSSASTTRDEIAQYEQWATNTNTYANLFGHLISAGKSGTGWNPNNTVVSFNKGKTGEKMSDWLANISGTAGYTQAVNDVLSGKAQFMNTVSGPGSSWIPQNGREWSSASQLFGTGLTAAQLLKVNSAPASTAQQQQLHITYTGPNVFSFSSNPGGAVGQALTATNAGNGGGQANTAPPVSPGFDWGRLINPLGINL